MGDYTVPNGHVGVHEKTLVASTVDTVTFSVDVAGATPGWGRPPKKVEILSDGADDIYVTTDGSAPTVRGTSCYRVPALSGSTVIGVQDSNARDAVVIKLISEGTPTYSVSRAE